MIARKTRQRLALIESRLRPPDPTVEELKNLIAWSTPEVLGSAIEELTRKRLFDTKPAHEPPGCSQCGHSGPPLQKAIQSSELASSVPHRVSRDVSIQELVTAIERSSIDVLNDALALAFCELDSTKTLIEIRCPNCGHSVFDLVEPKGRTSAPNDDRIPA